MLPARVVCSTWLCAGALGACRPARPAPELDARRAAFSLVTYNVAGLPAGLSASHPERNHARIGALLGGYDIAVVQEDFAFHDALTRRLSLPYRLSYELDLPDGLFANPSGLASFSRFPFARAEQAVWARCHGYLRHDSDCLADKGFSVAEYTFEVADGRRATIDVYNLHMDSGHSPQDVAARAAQVDQLIAFMRRRSGRRAVIVAGDTNMAADEAALARLLSELRLNDACAITHCPEPERIDRVLFRGSAGVELAVAGWRTARRFVDRAGAPLSDHLAVVVDFVAASRSKGERVAGASRR